MPRVLPVSKNTRNPLVSGTVRDLVVGSGLEFDERGEHELRGITGRWRLLAVRLVPGTSTWRIRDTVAGDDDGGGEGPFRHAGDGPGGSPAGGSSGFS